MKMYIVLIFVIINRPSLNDMWIAMMVLRRGWYNSQLQVISIFCSIFLADGLILSSFSEGLVFCGVIAKGYGFSNSVNTICAWVRGEGDALILEICYWNICRSATVIFGFFLDKRRISLNRSRGYKEGGTRSPPKKNKQKSKSTQITV